MHVRCSLWPFLVSSKSHRLQDLLIEKTKSHNPILCKNNFRVKTSKFPRSCNTSSPVCTTCCCDGKRSRDNRIIELSADRINLCTKICSVTQEAKYPGDDFFPQAYIHFDKSLNAKCSGEWILGVLLIEFMKVSRHSKIKIPNKDKEYSFHDSSDFTISGMPTLLVLDQMQTGLYMFKP